MHQFWHVATGSDIALPHGAIVLIGEHAGRNISVAQGLHRLLTVAISEFPHVRGAKPMRDTPAVGRAPVRVHDVGEVLKPGKRHWVRIPTVRHPITTPPGGRSVRNYCP